MRRGKQEQSRVISLMNTRSHSQRNGTRFVRLLLNLRVWLVAICILTGYQVFWATYTYSAFLQTQFGLDAVAMAA